MDFPQVPFDGKSFLYKAIAAFALILLFIGLTSIIRVGTFTLAEPELNSKDVSFESEGIYREDSSECCPQPMFEIEYHYKMTEDYELSHYVPIEFYVNMKTDAGTVTNEFGERIGKITYTLQIFSLAIYRSDGVLIDNYYLWDNSGYEYALHNFIVDTSDLIDEEATSFFFAIDYYRHYQLDGNLVVDSTSSNGVEWKDVGTDDVTLHHADQIEGSLDGFEVTFTNKLIHQPLFLVGTLIFLAALSIMIYRSIDHEDLNQAEDLEGDIMHGPFFAPWKRKIDN